MKILQSRSFQKKVKKFTKKEKKALDGEVKKIAKDPTLGVEKKSDLKGVFVHKFKIHSIQYLLSYRLQNENIELIMIGQHENYYRDLKSYLKNQYNKN
ncbi:MAG: type II toxin-antitoxin system RelE/ParE family toxin [Nitrospinae bacterium]|nr:type II toxin-antitoxin system RelE/ParE family toxin [Nitrospinota bacterium]